MANNGLTIKIRGRERVIHQAVTEGDHWVPMCEPGYRAYEHGALTIQNPMSSQVTCEHCQKLVAG